MSTKKADLIIHLIEWDAREAIPGEEDVTMAMTVAAKKIKKAEVQNEISPDQIG